jgi:hypothetical protein
MKIWVVEEVAMCRGLRRLVIVTAPECADAGKAVTNVGGIRNLAELAVADAVDPGRDLLGDHLSDGLGETPFERRLIKLAAGLPRF